MVRSASKNKQQILLVTGMLGAGKSTVLRELEDLGWETIDNCPIRALEGLISGEEGGPPLALGVDCRTRGFIPAEIIKKIEDLNARDDVTASTMFLDCATDELVRRFNETRRRHFFAKDRQLTSGIKAEREFLGPLRQSAEVVIDTTLYSSNDLKMAIREMFAGNSPRGLTVIVSSFAFSRGMPPVADLVFDMRYLDNPHWAPGLRTKTGLDEGVGAHIRKDPFFDSSFNRIKELILELLPRYAAQGKSYMNIAFGCTGGQHRSVFVAEQMAHALREAGFSPSVLHRNLGSKASEMLEGPHQT